MKLKLAALTLIAFVCWLVPLKTLAQETYKPKQKVEQVTSPSNEQNHEVAGGVPVTLETHNSRTLPIRQNHASTTSVYNGRYYSKEEIQQLIRDYSAQYGIPAEVPLCIARLESGFNQFSKNESSSASGVFQYLSSTWLGTDEHKAGLSFFDADANVRAAIKYMASRKSTSPWVVGPNCPTL